MKKVFALILGFVFSFVGYSQSCLPDGIEFTSQAQIDSFQINYPNCSEIEGDVTINGYDINNLNGLSLLSTIGGMIRIQDNPLLTNFIGLNGLITIGGHLQIFDNNSLVNLTGLENLTSIQGNIVISFNNILTSLISLDNINAGSITDLLIVDNISLSTCDAKSICGYLASPNGEIMIFGNATGCSSQEEVEAACGVGIDNNSTQTNHITIYPNPSTTTITISKPSTTTVNNTTLFIYNVNAQKVISRTITEPITEMDISALPGGVYFARITTDRTVLVSKFIKQ